MHTPLAPLAVKFFSFSKIGVRFDASVCVVAALVVVGVTPIARGVDIISNGPVSYLKGSDAIDPRPGSQGAGVCFNSLFYTVPGEGAGPKPCSPTPTPPACCDEGHLLPNQRFDIAYEPTVLPVQSSDWWTGVGLQWYVPSDHDGWASGWRGRNGNFDGTIRSKGFISEPFFYQFVDFTVEHRQEPLQPPHGLRLWNQNAMAVKTDGVIPPPPPTPTPTGTPTPATPIPTPTPAPFNAANNIVNRASLAPEEQAVVTVGLEGVHPLGTTEPANAPWTNVRVRKYSDWGLVLAYTNNGNQMEITMANGSPCTWFERTQGQANFLVWAGGPTDQGFEQPTVWQNENGVLGLTVQSPFNPDNRIPQTVSKAAYLVIADQGTWERTNANNGQQSMFRNSTATKVVVLAMPHNIRFEDRSLKEAGEILKPFACRKVVDSRIDYPPIPQSTPSVIINGQTVTLGYSPTDHQVALQLRVETQPFLPGDCAPAAGQLLFPHQVKSLHPGQRENLDGRYVWHGIMGPLRFYKGSSFVQLIDTKGFLPFFPADVADSNLRNPLPPSQLAVDDIYETMRNWFYLEEFQTGGNHIDSFVRNIGTYDNQQVNTYQPNLSTLIESLMIADQLADSTNLRGIDGSTNSLNACLCKPKTQVAAEMRDYILQALKELVGQWADVYTAQFMQNNPQFNTTYGFPAGFGSVQDLNDHHFHYGYFLRAAAAIGRYDRPWLDQYLPLFDQLRKDVANYNRNDLAYPFLRNFSPFYGHSWANGTSALVGADQESTSEAINFSAGLLELGLLLGNNEWRDMGMYMYEQEILAAEQYWFNQDATLGNIPPRPPIDPNEVRYNGNWPEQFVTFRGPDNGVWHSTLAGIVNQRSITRDNFFGVGIAGTYFIQLIPMSANTLYVGRNQDWLRATWKQYLLDTGAQGNPNFESLFETFFAALQARMPASGQGINGTGLNAALTRIAREHTFRPDGTNTMAKYWAYTNALLGQVDTSIVADIPAYGVFKDSGTSENRFVAYNPTNQPVTATFKNRVTNNVVATFTVPARKIVSKSSAGGRPSTFEPSQISTPASRLYLGPTTGPTPLPMIGQLSSCPGTWLPPNGTFPYPRLSTDIDRIKPSLSIVPISTGNCSDIDLPGGPQCQNSNKAYAEWEGTFKGNRVGSRPQTQMIIYTDPALHIGWEQDPRIRANTSVRIEYYFDANSNIPDRIENYGEAPSSSGNSFVMVKNKITPYYFGCYSDDRNFGQCRQGDQSGLYGLGNPGLYVKLDNRPLPGRPPDGAGKPFPASVTCGKIKVQVYGKVGDVQNIKVPVPVSVGTSPLLNRASWVQPPYDGGECTPTCTPTPTPTP